MVPLRLHRVVLIFFSVSFVLATVDQLVIWTGMPAYVRVIASGLATGGIVFVLSLRAGSLLRLAMKPIPIQEDILKRLHAAQSGVSGALQKPPRVTIYHSFRPVAFSVNDGFDAEIFISSGMVLALSQTSVAAVLAHECGHIHEKHPLRHSIVLGLLAGTKMSVGIPAAVVLPVILAYLLMLRDWEYIADRFAFHHVGCGALIEAFSEYRIVTGFEKSNFLTALLSTHPSIRHRVAALREYSAAGGVLNIPWWRSYIPRQPKASANVAGHLKCPETTFEEHIS